MFMFMFLNKSYKKRLLTLSTGIKTARENLFIVNNRAVNNTFYLLLFYYSKLIISVKSLANKNNGSQNSSVKTNGTLTLLQHHKDLYCIVK